MSHLSAPEFIDFADGTLPPQRAAHVERCESCRAQAAAVQDALRLADGAAPVPEPSPFFWDQLSARVREAIDAPRPRAPLGFGFRGFQPDVAIAALAVVFVLAAVVIPGVRRAAAPKQVATTSDIASGGAAPALDVWLDANHLEEWAVLTAAAEDLHLDDARAAGMSVQPAAVDRAVTGLTRAELSELGRLLQSELKRSSN